MPPLKNAVIAGYVAGDDLTVTRTVINIPAGRTLVKGWLTVKTTATDADPGLIQKVITTTSQAGIGQITDAGASGTGAVVFILTAVNTGTTLAAGRTYYYDLQIKFDDATIATLEVGTLSFAQGVTAATT